MPWLPEPGCKRLARNPRLGSSALWVDGPVGRRNTVLIAEVDTPAVLIDLDIAERNMLRLASYCREKNLRLRPHTKTHKIPELAPKQLELGACAITVAKPSEARVMVDVGIQDVLVASPIVT